jgi:Fe-S-cluster containining protein
MNRSKVPLMSQDNNGETYSYDVCINCKTTCCQDAKPPLSDERKKILTQYLQEHGLNLDNPFSTEGGYTFPSVDKDDVCVFYDRKTKHCIVHPVKPETCVSSPITFDINFHTGMVEFYLKKAVICEYVGVLLHDKPALKQLFLVAHDKIVELIKQLSADELRTICEIEEPDTFKYCQEPLPMEVARKLDL